MLLLLSQFSPLCPPPAHAPFPQLIPTLLSLSMEILKNLNNSLIVSLAQPLLMKKVRVWSSKSFVHPDFTISQLCDLVKIVQALVSSFIIKRSCSLICEVRNESFLIMVKGCKALENVGKQQQKMSSWALAGQLSWLVFSQSTTAVG